MKKEIIEITEGDSAKKQADRMVEKFPKPQDDKGDKGNNKGNNKNGN